MNHRFCALRLPRTSTRSTYHAPYYCAFSTSPKSSQDSSNRGPFSFDWKELRSPPNILTLCRLGCTPLLSYTIVTQNFEAALGGCLAAAASDVLDGYLAKNYGMSTTLGSYLDPLADKIMINVIAVSLWYVDIGTVLIPTPLLVMWLTRDTLLVAGTIRHLHSKSGASPLSVQPTTISKLNTGLQFSTLAVGLVHPLAPTHALLLPSLWWGTGATTIGSSVSYARHSAFVEPVATKPRDDKTS